MIQQRDHLVDPPPMPTGCTVPVGGGDFRAVFDSCAGDCYQVARRITLDAALAEDVVQNVFLAYWHGDARFDPSRGSVRSWLLTVTHHKAVDAVRHNQRHSGRRSGHDLTDQALNWLPSDDDVEELGLRGTRAAHVTEALAALTGVQREVILLGYYGGYSQTEIATLTGAALGTVKTRTLHALKNLRLNLDLAALAGDEGWHRQLTAV
jgi:RNA polymerase sigma factor (sigma-70 family)